MLKNRYMQYMLAACAFSSSNVMFMDLLQLHVGPVDIANQFGYSGIRAWFSWQSIPPLFFCRNTKSLDGRARTQGA